MVREHNGRDAWCIAPRRGALAWRQRAHDAGERAQVPFQSRQYLGRLAGAMAAVGGVQLRARREPQRSANQGTVKSTGRAAGRALRTVNEAVLRALEGESAGGHDPVPEGRLSAGANEARDLGGGFRERGVQGRWNAGGRRAERAGDAVASRDKRFQAAMATQPVRQTIPARGFSRHEQRAEQGLDADRLDQKPGFARDQRTGVPVAELGPQDIIGDENGDVAIGRNLDAGGTQASLQRCGISGAQRDNRYGLGGETRPRKRGRDAEMLPESRDLSWLDADILGEVAAGFQVIERLEDLLGGIAAGERGEDRFDLVGAVQHAGERRIERIRQPRVPALGNKKKPTIPTDDGLQGRLEAWTSRRVDVHEAFLGGIGPLTAPGRPGRSALQDLQRHAIPHPLTRRLSTRTIWSKYPDGWPMLFSYSLIALVGSLSSRLL